MNIKAHLESRDYMWADYRDHAIDEELSLLTVYLREYNGRQTGYQVYNPNTTVKQSNIPREARYFTHLPKGVRGVWGLETDSGTGPLFVVESVFNAATLHYLGFNAIALLGSCAKAHIEQLRLLRRPIIVIGDNDPAGRKFAGQVLRGVPNSFSLEFEEDVNDTPHNELLDKVRSLEEIT